MTDCNHCGYTEPLSYCGNCGSSDTCDCEMLSRGELEALRAENEALKARERVLVEALEPYSKEENWATGGNGEYDWEEAIYLDQGYEGAKQALSAIPEDVRELYRLERKIISAALKVINQPPEGMWDLRMVVQALQAHKEKMRNA